MVVTAASLPGTVIDGHAHVHSCFPVPEFLDRAHRNLSSAAPGASNAVLALCLTEGAQANYFALFAELAAGRPTSLAPGGLGGWGMAATDDAASVTALKGDRRLALIAGFQVATGDGLEVLLVGTRQRLPDGIPLVDALRLGREQGAICIIPWGAGKWFFRRGRLLQRIITESRPGDLFLGDESGRPVFWPTPRHFRVAAERGIRVLPGTDPLPFPDETGRAGSFGCWMAERIDLRRPAETLKQALRDPRVALHPFGALERPWSFLRHQLGMQVRKHRPARLAPAASAG